MGFCLQVKLLLWKNLTLKKRRPVVLVFELFIPLVLFFILLGIRKKQPSYPMGSSSFHAFPLPSAGVIAIMQAFCDNGIKHEDGFSRLPNSTVAAFLTNLNNVAKNHSFFRPGFTLSDMDEIPGIYRNLIEDSIMVHDRFEKVEKAQLGSLLKNRSEFIDTISQNLNLSHNALDLLLNSTLDMKTIFQMIFGGPNASEGGQIPNPFTFTEYIVTSEPEDNEKFLDSSTDRVYSVLDYILQNKEKAGVLGEALNWILNTQTGIPAPEIDPVKAAEALKELLFSTYSLRKAMCTGTGMPAIVLPDPHEETDNTDIIKLKSDICNMSDYELNFIIEQLKANVDSEKLSEILPPWNITETQRRVRRLAEDLTKFSLFEQTLRNLSELASSLPQDACYSLNETAADTNQTLVTDMPKEEEEESDKKAKKQTPQYGLLRIWLGMQQMICGIESKMPENAFTDGSEINLDDLGMSKYQQEQIGILVHVLYSNPKVLYAPNNTAADDIVKKANETFELLELVSEYSQKMLNVSDEIRWYLAQNSTDRSLATLQHIRRNLRQYPSILHSLNSSSLHEFVERSFVGFQEILENKDMVFQQLTDKEVFLQQLDNIDNAACSWISLMSGLSLNMFRGFSSEDDVLDYFKHKAYSDNVTVLASVIFNMEADGSLPKHMIYKIRQNASFTDTTNLVRNRFWFPGPRNWGYKYYQFGFVWIQDILERAMISLYAGRDITEPGSYVHQFPYPCYIQDQFLFMIEHVMPLCMAISWVYSVAMLVQSIVYEKEQRLKEVMKTMGLNNAVHWLAWFITSFIHMTITSAMLTLILKYGQVLTYSDPVLIFLILEIFVLANIAFSFLVSVLYSKAKLAAACAGIVYFLTYVPYMYIAVREEAAHDRIPFWVKSIASLLSTTAFGLGAKYFAFYEEVGVGVQWSNIRVSPVEDDEFSLFNVAVMMLMDALIYGLLVWYIENVHPGSYGLPKPWYFPFTKSYWLGHPRGDVECSWFGDFWHKIFYIRHKTLGASESDQACAMQNRGSDNNYFEPDPVHLPLGVAIDNLVKIFKKGSKAAVNKLTLNLYEGQITSFLGHNGAGKTTTMSILTGLFPPSSGYATIYGHDIRTEMDTIRQSMGMCPQHNVLFDELTVEEHLWFYASLKSTPERDFTEEMDKMIEDLALPLKRHSKVDCLSGGMKRKLSVAIAFVGGSRVVILDEPTAGVDPYSRRAIWDLILKYKKGRTILLSTHHMDEADILGDRIAIISNGHLRCCGTSLFLKNNLGEGYHLCIVKKASSGIRSMAGEGCVEKTVTEFICKYVPTAYLACENKRELHYVLPAAELRKGSFEKLFTALENRLVDLSITSYGIKNTTLEEVFLLVAENWYSESAENERSPKYQRRSQASDTVTQSDSSPVVGTSDTVTSPISSASQASDTGSSKTGQNTDSKVKKHVRYGSADYYQLESYDQPMVENKGRHRWEGAGSSRVEGKLLLLHQFNAIMLKRYYCTKRNWKGLFSQILLPAFFVSVAMSVALTAPQIEVLPPLILSPSQYYNYTQPEGNVIPFANSKKDLEVESWSNDSNSVDLVQTLRLPSGVGATCVLTNLTLPTDKMNFTIRNYKLVSTYFEPMCQSVFVPGLPLENFVPSPPTVSPLGAKVTQSDRKNTTLHTTTTPPSTKERYYPYCQCSDDGTGYQCQTYGYKDPPSFKVVTGDVLLDVSGQNEHEYYLYTTDMYRLRRYGAFSFGLVRDYVSPEFGQEAPSLFRKIAVRNVAKVWYNNKGYHSMPTYVNSLNNAILRANHPEFRTNPTVTSSYGITVINHPMTDTSYMLSRDQILQGTDVLIAIFIIVAMSFVPASFVLFLVYERYTKAKHLQAVSGVNAVVYWVANYAWDMCSYVVPATCCVLILLVFDIPAYASPKNFPAVVSLFLMYGWSITPVMYPVSFIFEEPSTAYIFLIVINLFIGITCVVTSFLLEVFSYDAYLGQVHNVLKAIFLMFPNYCLGRGLMDIAFNEYNNFFLFKTGQYDKMQSPFAWNLITRKLFAMAVSGLAFFVITLLCEFNFFIKPKRLTISSYSHPEEDEDVAEERRRVLSGRADADVLRLVNLTKIYQTGKLGKQLAVNKLCLGVPEGECLGLLGVNGAGKSTTFKMLTGDTSITAGDAHLHGYSVSQELRKVQQYIGYCPQFDALFDELTAREHLQLYSRFRGIPYKEESKVVEWALKKLDLMQYADRASGTYSGGNKRKLSTAIALIGAPSVIYLDEPTTGMDPYTRRFLWNLIIELVRGGRSVVLTSHSMEECEALCSRLAIMVNGTFRCLGSIQHLKNRFGEGYCITVRTKDNEHEQVQQWFGRVFPDSTLKEKHFNMLQYELKSENISLAYVFSKMEAALTDLPVEEYSVSQNTLDNVFINFVKQQSDLAPASSIANFGKPLSLTTAEESLEDSCDDDVALQMDRSHKSESYNEEETSVENDEQITSL